MTGSGRAELTIWPAEPWAPRWLVNLIGVDYFGHVTHVNLYSSWERCDAAMEEVGRLKQLTELDAGNSSLADADMSHLKGLVADSRNSVSIVLRSATAVWLI